MRRSLARLIQSHRKKSGLTQAQLATMAGVGKTVVFDVEHGKKTIQFATIQKMLKVLNIHLIAQSPLEGDIDIEEW